MLTSAMQTARTLLRRSGVRGPLEALGIIGAGKRAYERRILRAGIHSADVLGHRLTFRVQTPTEITRIDSVALEAPFLGRLLDALRPGDIAFDVGANIGVFSLACAARGGTLSAPVRVHAFEPEPRNFDHLRENIALNTLDALITPHRLALGSEAGTAPLFTSGEHGTGTHSLVAGAAASAGAVDISIDTMSAVARTVNATPDVVKIDVEGFELAVLDGMHELLARGKPRELFIEVHPPKLRAAGTDPAALDALLTRHRYTLAWRLERGDEAHVHYRAPGAAAGDRGGTVRR